MWIPSFNLTNTAYKWPTKSAKESLEGIGRHQLGTAKGDCSINASESNIAKIQCAQNEALRIT